MTNKQKRRIVNITAVILAVLLLLQLQPLIVQARQGVDGSFGYRPISHECLGWIVPADSISWLPFTDSNFQLGYFNFHYSLTKEDFDAATVMCMGQDISFGE